MYRSRLRPRAVLPVPVLALLLPLLAALPAADAGERDGDRPAFDLQAHRGGLGLTVESTSRRSPGHSSSV